MKYRLWAAKQGTGKHLQIRSLQHQKPKGELLYVIAFFEKWTSTMLDPSSKTAQEEKALCRQNLISNIKDPAKLKILMPDYAPWARRMCYSVSLAKIA